mgnify:CR=1 FL=1
MVGSQYQPARQQSEHISSPSSAQTATLKRAFPANNAVSVNPRGQERLLDVRLPLRLPPPLFITISSPHTSLPDHLRFHGFPQEAKTYEGSTTPVDIIPRQLIFEMGGARALLWETSQLLVVCEKAAREQLKDQELPESLKLSCNNLSQSQFAQVSKMSLITAPSVLLALQSSCQGDVSKGAETSRGLIIPIHALIYVMQGAALKPLRQPIAPDEEERQHGAASDAVELPILRFSVPRPYQFYRTHQFLYTNDTRELRSSLLPPSLIGTSGQDSAQGASQKSNPAMARPTVSSLLRHAWLIHAAWANGAAIGVLSEDYWKTLSDSRLGRNMLLLERNIADRKYRTLAPP